MTKEEIENYQLFTKYSSLITHNPLNNEGTGLESFNGLSIFGSGLSRISTVDFSVNIDSAQREKISNFVSVANSINEKLIWFNFYSSRPESLESILSLNFIHAKHVFWTAMFKNISQQLMPVNQGKLTKIHSSNVDLFAKWMTVVSSGFGFDQNKQKLTADVLMRLNSKDNAFYYLYEIFGRPVSACQVHIVGEQASLYWVATAKEEQGNGFAKLMILEIEQMLQEMGISKIHLQSTQQGLRTYKAIGFQEIGKIDIYLSKH